MLKKEFTMKKYKVIIDTDPGVDDSTCLTFAFFDEKLDIKLLTTVSGNVSIEKNTRNLLHLLDKFRKDYPVAVGTDKPLIRPAKRAEYIHSKNGLGGYIPPETTVHQPIKEDAVEAMYKILKDGNGDITPLVLGPHTNIATLLIKHPDIVKKIPKIIFMGGSPSDVPGFTNHISFNISSDPESFKIVLESGIPLVMIPYDMGRKHSYLSEEFVENLNGMNDVANFLYTMFKTYWEPNFPDKRIAMNDTCAYMYLRYKSLFKCKRANVTVDTELEPGKTYVDFNKHGNVLITVGLKRKKFLKIITKKLKDFDNFKFDN